MLKISLIVFSSGGVSSTQSRPLDPKRTAKLLHNEKENKSPWQNHNVYNSSSLFHKVSVLSKRLYRLIHSSSFLHILQFASMQGLLPLKLNFFKLNKECCCSSIRTSFQHSQDRAWGTFLYMPITVLITNSGYCQSFPSLACLQLNNLLN